MLPQLEALLATWGTEQSRHVRSIRQEPHRAVTNGSFSISRPSQLHGVISLALLAQASSLSPSSNAPNDSLEHRSPRSQREMASSHCSHNSAAPLSWREARSNRFARKKVVLAVETGIRRAYICHLSFTAGNECDGAVSVQPIFVMSS